MANSYYKNLFQNGYNKPKPQAQAQVPGQSSVIVPGVSKNVITNTTAQKIPLTKQSNLTEAGNLFENNITDILSGNKQAPGVALAQQQATRSNALDNTNSLAQAKQQAAAAGAKPGTALYNRLIAQANAGAQSNALARSGQVATLQTQGYQNALAQGNQLEADAYGKASAERAYGDERDDVSYGRQLNERDYGDSRDDKAIDLALKNRDFGAKEALDTFSMQNTLDRQAQDDFNREKEFDATMSRQESLDDQWERTFGASEDQRGLDNTFRNSQQTEDTRRFDLSRGDQLGRDAVSNEQWLKQFTSGEDQRGLDNQYRSSTLANSEDQRALDNAFRGSQASDDRERFDLNRGDEISRQAKADEQWEKSFGEGTRQFDLNRGDDLAQQGISNDQWLKQFEAGRDDRSSDTAFRDSQAADDRSRFDLTRGDELSRQAKTDEKWEKEFGASRTDRADDVAFRDTTRQDSLDAQAKADEQWLKQFDANRSDRASDTEFRDISRQDELSKQAKADEQWEKSFGSSEDQRKLENQRYETEYSDTRDDISYERDQDEFKDLLEGLGSEKAKSALQQAKITGDYKTAYQNLYQDGSLKKEYQDMSPEEAKKQARIDELRQVFPDMSDEEIAAKVQGDLRTDYDLERAGIENEASKALIEKRINNIQDVQDFDSLSAREISALSSNPELVNEYKAKGFIVPASKLTSQTTNNNGSVVNALAGAAVTADDVAKKGIVVGKTVQMEDGSIVRVTSVKSANKQGTQVRGTDAKTGKEILIYDSMAKK